MFINSRKVGRRTPGKKAVLYPCTWRIVANVVKHVAKEQQSDCPLELYLQRKKVPCCKQTTSITLEMQSPYHSVSSGSCNNCRLFPRLVALLSANYLCHMRKSWANTPALQQHEQTMQSKRAQVVHKEKRKTVKRPHHHSPLSILTRVQCADFGFPRSCRFSGSLKSFVFISVI